MPLSFFNFKPHPSDRAKKIDKILKFDIFIQRWKFCEIFDNFFFKPKKLNYRTHSSPLLVFSVWLQKSEKAFVWIEISMNFNPRFLNERSLQSLH